jgi:hypothetical protein
MPAVPSIPPAQGRSARIAVAYHSGYVTPRVRPKPSRPALPPYRARPPTSSRSTT